MSFEKLLEAILAQPPAPCDNCESRGECIDKKLACKSFEAYVESGISEPPTAPTKKTYARIFKSKEPKENPARRRERTDTMVVTAMLEQPEIAQVWL